MGPVVWSPVRPMSVVTSPRSTKALVRVGSWITVSVAEFQTEAINDLVNVGEFPFVVSQSIIMRKSELFIYTVLRCCNPPN